MKYFFLMLIVLVVSCRNEPKITGKTKTPESRSTGAMLEPDGKTYLSELPAEWVRLTEKDDKLIIFNSCDGGNMLITVSESGKTLLLHGQQEDIAFTITGIQSSANGAVVHTGGLDGKSSQDFNFQWVDKSKGLGRWSTRFNDGNDFSYSFVTANHEKDFNVINQPCKECWGDECDDAVEK